MLGQGQGYLNKQLFDWTTIMYIEERKWNNQGPNYTTGTRT